MLGESSSIQTKILLFEVIRMAGGVQGIGSKRECKLCIISFGSFHFFPGFVDGCLDMGRILNLDAIVPNDGCDGKVMVDSTV